MKKSDTNFLNFYTTKLCIGNMRIISLMIFLACFLPGISLANTLNEDVYLKQILNQLDAVQPLIPAAEKAQPKNERIQFHYTKYKDSQGKTHNGLLEDIQAIKSGINQKLNQVSVEPRQVIAVKGDYQ
jgi:RAQPRD family integrative conjugative element protein